MMDQVKRILDFLALSERLKFELRHSWLSSGRQESVAEHSWQMALMALLMHRHLEQPVDIEKTLKMILVHDLVEAEVGDVPFFETGERKQLKAAREQMAIEKIRAALDAATGQEIYDLWQEYEAKTTAEARFATALDHLEVQVQHNLADFSTWEPIEYDLVYTKMDGPCAVDPFLAAFCKAVKEQAERKMQAGGIEPAAIRQRLDEAAGRIAPPT
jgi:putative hydrolase of HD superfamily